MTTQTIHRPPERTEPARTTAAAGLRWARGLSAIMVVLMAAAALVGLLVDGVYRDAEPLAAMLRGYDLVTLLLAVPLLAVTLLPAWQYSARAQLLWVGMLAYAVYNYAIYAFGAAFNDLFLLHTAAFSIAVYALSLALANLDVAGIAAQFATVRRYGPRVRS